ncbi:hypothetical protein ACET3Z_022538 [Daucus carota]
MAFDSVTNAKDFAKKKKANRSAKLKQCKLDARRHQWLSQVNNQERKDQVDMSGGIQVSPTHGRNERDRVVKISEMNSGNGEHDGSVQHYSDSDSSSHSRISHSCSVGGSHFSGTSFTGSGGSSRSSSSSGRSVSGIMSEEEDDDNNDEDDGCVDDWEAVADAMAASDAKQQQEQDKPFQESPSEHENVNKLNCPPEFPNSQLLEVDIPKPKAENRKAWRPDDAFRPQSLPTLLKQHSFPIKLERHSGSGGVTCAIGISTQSSCPICCEDLDFTDSSFLPCYCGFRLCLFCHKRILEEDGRCPGCRKKYEHDGITCEGNGNFAEGSSPYRFARSYSMITKS